jgi:hypothetical protein
MSRLVREGISAALSLGDEVVAVTVTYPDADGQAVAEQLRRQWDEWHPGVRLVELTSPHRSLTAPVIDYLNELERSSDHDQLVVLIPEVQLARPWRRVLSNQRGFVLEQAIQHGTENVVVCRFRYQLSAVAGDD